MDAAFITRPGQQQEPLRYAIRALVNVSNFDPDQDRVWIIGDRPDWITGVEYLPGNRCGGKGPNIFDNWRLFCALNDGPETFAAFNDDIYATRPSTVVADEWREPLAAQCAREGGNGWWARSLAATLAYCSTLTPEPRSFELHRPVLMHRGQLREALDKAAASWTGSGEPPQWRSVYGNHWNTGVIQVPDVKAKHDQQVDLSKPWISTNGNSWRGWVGQQIRAMYTCPSRYERSRAD